MANITAGLPIGKKYVSRGRTITDGDFSLLTNLTWTTSVIHTDSQYMKTTQFGDRILAGPCVLSISQGLIGTSGIHDTFWEDGRRLLGLLGYEDVRFVAPVFPGDTLTTESEIIEARPTKNPRRGVVRFRDVARKQTGEVVCEFTRASLFEVAG